MADHLAFLWLRLETMGVVGSFRDMMRDAALMRLS